MPIYEYRCDNCGYQNSVLQKVNEQPLTICPKCGGNFRRLVSAPSIRFKGSGFYITDYKTNSNPSASNKSAEGNNTAQKGLPKEGSPKKDTLAS
ncbi:FmdB family regulatory protein [Thermotomaculum hydrothermale]|uniref:FmdB family regulatory protein n=1 Tax=Thermotomaculum hydrothermale TaxID=981385 RepID=A0A7R6SZL2_9BACT|nr:FmdB family zinc ribbon protein [Thermotomaculum hydrothermale]BBB32867.1 FmdB family regulatory protein [Thermotomaculum hydrothermale]